MRKETFNTKTRKYLTGGFSGFAWGPAFMFHYDKEKDCLLLCDNNCFMVGKEAARDIIRELERFIDAYPQEGIDNQNQYAQSLIEREKKDYPDRFRESKRSSTVGYVYFVSDDQGRIKIGRARDVNDRIKEYTKLPFEPEIVHTIKSNDYVLTEELFHLKFNKKRIRGEWFALSKKDIVWIKRGDYGKEILDSMILASG